MPKAKQKTKHLNESQILEFLDSDDDSDSDDDLPPVIVDNDFVPDDPVEVEEEVTYENIDTVSS